MSQSITYNPYPEGSGEGVILKDIIPDLLTIPNQIAMLSQYLLLNVFGELVGGRGGLVALQWLSTIKKRTGPFNFQSNDFSLKFVRQLLRYELPCSKNK